jgi:hypothetical protein
LDRGRAVAGSHARCPILAALRLEQHAERAAGHDRDGPRERAALSGRLEANRIALEGVREKEKVGQGTTLDVLNAELEYLGSQIQLVTAKRDRGRGRICPLRLSTPAGRTKP